MGELLLRYGPAVLAWGFFLARTRRGGGATRSVRWVLLGLAVSLTALSPAGYAAIGWLSGVPDLARLVGHGGMLLAIWAGQDFVAYMTGRQRNIRRHTWWTATVFAVMCLLFSLTPNLLPASPWVFEYVAVYVVGQVPALVRVTHLGVRYARLTADANLRMSMSLVAAGTTGALIYLLNKLVLAAAGRFDFAYPLGRTFMISKVLPASAHVLILLGAVLTALLRWTHRYQLYLRLRPLWRDLYRADAAIALDPPGIADRIAVRQLRLRLYRRAIEIRDGLLALHPYRDPGVAAAAMDRARREGMCGERLEAAVEAATIAAALSSRARGTLAVTPECRVRGGRDLDSDIKFLSQVARAYHQKVRARQPTRKPVP